MGQYIPLLPHILIISVAASFTGAVFYAIARFVESKWQLFPLVLGIPLLLFFLYALVASAAAGFLNVVYLAVFLALAALGGWFHRRAGGVSKDWSRAMFFMLVVDSASQIVGAMITTAMVTRSLPLINRTQTNWTFETGFLMIYVLIGSFGLYPTLVPLAVWVWRSMKIRPGIDVAASDLG